MSKFCFVLCLPPLTLNCLVDVKYVTLVPSPGLEDNEIKGFMHQSLWGKMYNTGKVKCMGCHLSVYTVEPVSSGHCMSRSPLSAVEPVSSGHCMSRSPLYAVEPVSSGHCMSAQVTSLYSGT